MRKAIWIMLLGLVSSGVCAEWEPIGRVDESTKYVDPASRRKEGDNVKMWLLDDYPEINRFGPWQFKSTRTQLEFDCLNERSRLIYISAHSENMGAGKVVGTSTTIKEWRPVAPGTLAGEQWKAACPKKWYEFWK